MPYKDKDKQREYQRQWILKRRLDYLSDKCCAECGQDDSSVLEIHHKNPSQKTTHRIWSWAQHRREEELNKCEILCGDCHKKQHAAPHGSKQMYERYKCRCDLCRAKKAETDRKYRERKKLRQK